MPVDKQQAEMLAALAVACRPSGAPRWDAPGVVAAVGKVKHLSLADVALAVIRAADDRDAQTPGVIGNLKSPCWRERPLRPEIPDPFDREATCGTCGDTQPLCRQKWAGDHEFESVVAVKKRSSEEESDVALIVAALRDEVSAGREAKPDLEPDKPAPAPNPGAQAARAALHPASRMSGHLPDLRALMPTPKETTP